MKKLLSSSCFIMTSFIYHCKFIFLGFCFLSMVVLIQKYFCTLYSFELLLFFLQQIQNLVIKLCGTVICIITTDNLISVLSSLMFTSNILECME